MPSDEVIGAIEASLVDARGAFHSAVTLAVEELRTMIEAHDAPAVDRSTRTAAELGDFAADRVDMDRFAAITGPGDTMDPVALALLQRAKATLSSIAQAGGAPFTVRVMHRGDLVADVGASLGIIGRAFGAARAAELVRLGRSAEAERDDVAGTFPFHRWTQAERRFAPPLVVYVDGEDLRAGGLSAFLDGTQKFVLVVDGATTPAPLVRLITPGVFVMQTSEVSELERLSAFDGPGVAALVGESCAHFVHDPSSGGTLAERLRVSHLPQPPKRALGRVSLFEQLEELKAIEWLATAGVIPAGAVAGASEPTSSTAADGSPAALADVPGRPSAGAPTSVDRLAALLLRQAGLSSVA